MWIQSKKKIPKIMSYILVMISDDKLFIAHYCITQMDHYSQQNLQCIPAFN